MGCITTIFLVLISRIGIVVWWLVNPLSHDLPFASWVLPGGLAFPAWLWLVLGGALLIDLAGHGGSYRHRNRIPYRRS
jgi:hypothetical protein